MSPLISASKDSIEGGRDAALEAAGAGVAGGAEAGADGTLTDVPGDNPFVG